MKKKFDTKSLISFLSESFTKKTSGKTSKDILKNSDKISIENFQKEMDLFLKDFGFLENIQSKKIRPLGKFGYTTYLKEDEFFNVKVITKIESGNQGYFGIKFSRSIVDSNYFNLCVEVVTSNRIRMFDNWCINLEDFSSVYKLYKNTFNNKESEKFKIKEEELSYTLLYRIQNFLKELKLKFDSYSNKDLELLTRALNFDENICSRNFSNIVLKGEGV